MKKAKQLAGLLALLSLVACGGSDDAADTPDGGGADADVADAATSDLTVTPSIYGFGPVLVGKVSSVATFTFTNNGSAAATGCAAPVRSGANAPDFSIVADNCGTADLAPGGSCTVDVTVQPSGAGLRSMTLERTCSTGGTASTVAEGVEVNRPMYIFISSVSYNGELGGLDGADAKCNTLANAEGTLTKPLNRTWKALLSKSTGGEVRARDRFAWSGPLYDMGDNVVTYNPSLWPWVDGDDGSSINVSETGGGPDDSFVWSGSSSTGESKGADVDCNGWTDGTNSYDGWAGETGLYPSDSWIDSFGSGCGDTYYGLHCISQ